MKYKYYLYLFIVITFLLTTYLYSVGEERKNSVQKYINTPRIGDIYKLKQDESDGEQWLTYYKVAEVQPGSIVFYPGKMMADASADYLLKHFDTSRPVVFNRESLKSIAEGRWNNNQYNNTTLIEIVRRQ